MSAAASSLVAVTPEWAKRVIEEQNLRNRPVSWATVRRYASDMADGKWRLTHQGIAFGTDGNLLDGQHRLLAVEESGVAVKMWVFYDVDSDGIVAIDQSLPRTAGDSITLSGEYGRVTNKEISVLRCLLRGPSGRAFRLTNDQLGRAYGMHKEAIRFGIRAVDRESRMRYLTSAQPKAVAAAASYTLPRETIESFFKELRSSRGESTNTAVDLAFQMLVSQGARTGRTLTGLVLYGRMERALRAYADGENIKILRTPVGRIFDLPAGSSFTSFIGRSRRRSMKDRTAGIISMARRCIADIDGPFDLTEAHDALPAVWRARTLKKTMSSVLSQMVRSGEIRVHRSREEGVPSTLWIAND